MATSNGSSGDITVGTSGTDTFGHRIRVEMQILQLGETLTRRHHRSVLLVAATLAAFASTSAMAAGPPCEPEAKIAPANQIVNENDLVTLNGTAVERRDVLFLAPDRGPQRDAEQ